MLALKLPGLESAAISRQGMIYILSESMRRRVLCLQRFDFIVESSLLSLELKVFDAKFTVQLNGYEHVQEFDLYDKFVRIYS